MHYAQILGRRRPPHRKSRYRCASGAVTGRFPDLNRGFRNASQIARKGSRTVPYSHLISAISLTLLFNGRGPLHRWRRVCNRHRGPRRRLHSAPVAPRRNQVFAKVKRRSATTPYTHDARNTRRTTHAVPLAGKAWRQSLHRSLMVTSGAGRHSGPAMRRAARNPPVSPPNPRRSPLALAHPWAPPPPTHGHPAHKMSGSAETLGEQRRDAEGAVECPSRRGDVRDPAVAAGSRVAQWSRAALFAGARLSRQRGAARQRDAPRGGINVGKVVVVFSIATLLMHTRA